MSNESKSLTEGQAHSTAQYLEALWAAIEADDNGEGTSDYEPRDELDQLPLGVVWEVGEPFAVVLGTGGPHVEITGGGRQGGYALHVYWGGDHSVRRGEAITKTGEYFREMYEEMTD